jgi:hypothetical protein
MLPKSPSPARCRRTLAILSALLCTAAGLAACSGNGVSVTMPGAGLKCVDDSPTCIAERQATMKAMLADPNRSWVSQRPDAAAYASGVRLFAFKSKKKEMSCAELQAGKREADAGPAVLRTPGNGLSHSQVSRGVILAHEVSRELGNELNRRCGRS